MGTKGAYGFRVDEQDKVTYNHFDSYPNGLGRNVALYVTRTPIEKIREVASKIILVDKKI